MIKHFAPGKIMLTGEYAVFHGAPAIAFPTKMGQHFTWTESPSEGLTWKSYDPNALWFEAHWDKMGKLLSCTDEDVAKNLETLFRGAQKLNPCFNPFKGSVETKLDFPREYGLGSSSTLICLIGKWAEVSPMELFLKNWKGSGYDVAVAMENHPIEFHYNKGAPTWQRINLQPNESQNWFFVYSNVKQSTYAEIDRIADKKLSDAQRASLEKIHRELKSNLDSDSWVELLSQHEAIISSFINKPSINEHFFDNEKYSGFAKSLGAWGGDFVLLYLENPSIELKPIEKKFPIVINWNNFLQQDL
jgi:mevalonate kinase